MVITREMVLQVIARYEPGAIYPLVETGQWGTVLEMEREGLVTITGGGKDLGELRLTDKGRAELAKLAKPEANT